MIIYIKYGELTLKGKNKSVFINKLYENVKNRLRDFKLIKIQKEYDNMYISNVSDDNVNEIINSLKFVPGICYIIKAYETKSDLDILSKDLLEKIEFSKFKTFKVIVKRCDKSYPIESTDLARKMGGIILDAFPHLNVDVKKPELNVYIEIKQNNTAIYYSERIPGMGGFPLGINGKALVLLSGGIDSPVAAKLLMKKGFHVDFLTFITPPHTSEEALEKVRKLRKIITEDEKLEKSKLFICNFTNLQSELAHMSNKQYQITIMRRYFFRIARDLCKKYDYIAIGTGESLGQVASQTTESMQTIQDAIGSFLVLRPLLTYDKNEIINLSKIFRTYETSILPFSDCCSLFVPKSPVTKPTIRQAEKIEKELELAEAIYETFLDKYLTKEE
ncbi:MAG: tRNA 4-thiouridine(8) synthase ThiI [Mycoplasmataceae bacterium]|jgi:thiamine biosynthesis protein ThiI|nr:tRNA 4-thiouridine(8) synthase ThiI [Mycoplasmataceae bacterium]